MGRSSTGETKKAILRVRITDELDARLESAMKATGFQGLKEHFAAMMVAKGLDLSQYEQNLIRNAGPLFAAESTQRNANHAGSDVQGQATIVGRNGVVREYDIPLDGGSEDAQDPRRQAK